MSSEDSNTSDTNADVECDKSDAKFVVRPLPWRSEKCESFFLSLDHKHAKGQSKKSSLMTYQRTKGLPSDRPKPDGVPVWAVKSERFA